MQVLFEAGNRAVNTFMKSLPSWWKTNSITQHRLSSAWSIKLGNEERQGFYNNTNASNNK